MARRVKRPPAKERVYELCGGNLAAFEDHHSQEYLLAGAAGSGKTLAGLIKLLQFGSDHPGARMLIVRKTRKSLTETALVTWERDVLGEGHPIIRKPIDRGHRHAYRWRNGSCLVTGGMDNPDKVLSSEWDLIYVPEATELSLVDWETLGGRLRANAGPYDQIFGDCNPTTPHHWLYKRCVAGQAKLYASGHLDNPRYYDHALRKWTEAGRRYVLGRLAQMTGSRRDRFLLGKWVAAEGVVYAFDPEVHQLPRGWRPPRDWKRVWGIDWGDRAPTVLGLWAVEPGPAARLHAYREVMKCHLRADELGRWARAELESGREVPPLAVVCDVDDGTGKIPLFEAASGLSCEVADKADRDKGIQDAQARFDYQADPATGAVTERPRIYFAEAALAHPPDRALVDEGRPTSGIEELVGYVWDPKFLKDEPIAENDHFMDMMRYVVRWVDTHLAGGERTYHGPTGTPLVPEYLGGTDGLGSATGW